MARYTGPKTKIARKFGEPIYGADKAYEKRNHENKNYPPGQHGAAKKRSKVSEYGTQLKEKEKVKYTYGVLERQFRNLYTEASKMKGIKGVNLLMLLESRLDNIVYRLGIAPTRAAARQLVSHRHICLNGEVVGIPSVHVKPGDVIGVRERSKSLEVITNSLAAAPAKYSWLEWNSAKLEGKFLNLPERTEIPENINEQLIVELYSK
ncbi:MAG: 30S ribosomal protein S4 [Candidatus Egerieousia sp.]